MDLQGPHPAGKSRGSQLYFIPRPDSAFDDSAGDHGAEAIHGKDPVDRQTKGSNGAFLLGVQHQIVQGVLQFRKPRSRNGGNGQDGLSRQKRALYQFRRLGADQLQPDGVHQVSLGQHHQPVPDAQ